MDFAKTLWLFDDATLEAMHTIAVAFYEDHKGDDETGKMAEDADMIREAVEKEMTKRNAVWEISEDGKFRWHRRH